MKYNKFWKIDIKTNTKANNSIAAKTAILGISENYQSYLINAGSIKSNGRKNTLTHTHTNI